MMLAQRITQAQVDYVLAHLNDRPRSKVAQAAGICMSTMYRIVREHGGELRHDLSTKREGIENTIRQYYPTMTAKEICDRFGYSKTRVNTWAKRLGVRHSAETEERIRQDNMARLDDARAQMDYGAAHVKWRRKRRLDELRVLSGLPQKTRFKLKSINHKAYKAKWYLEHRYGYFGMAGEAYALFYDGETRRCIHEKHYTEKYGLRFVQADGYGKEMENDDNEDADI